LGESSIFLLDSGTESSIESGSLFGIKPMVGFSCAADGVVDGAVCGG
jgi:hypothetical protein